MGEVSITDAPPWADRLTALHAVATTRVQQPADWSHTVERARTISVGALLLTTAAQALPAQVDLGALQHLVPLVCAASSGVSHPARDRPAGPP